MCILKANRKRIKCRTSWHFLSSGYRSDRCMGRIFPGRDRLGPSWFFGHTTGKSSATFVVTRALLSPRDKISNSQERNVKQILFSMSKLHFVQHYYYLFLCESVIFSRETHVNLKIFRAANRASGGRNYRRKINWKDAFTSPRAKTVVRLCLFFAPKMTTNQMRVLWKFKVRENSQKLGVACPIQNPILVFAIWSFGALGFHLEMSNR